MYRSGFLAFTAAAFLTTCLAHFSSAAEPVSGDKELQRALAELCRKHNVPSLTVAVVRSDGVVAAECSGVRKRGRSEAVELSDRHPLASCTKSMTATLVAVLVEAGKINWDTTIAEVWPRAGQKHLHAVLRDVTLDELLAHQSGLGSDLSDYKNVKPDVWVSFFTEADKPRTERRRMLELILGLKPPHPRGEHHYSNLGYVVAAAMLETRGGDSFENLMQRHLFKSLRMTTAEFHTLADAREQKPPLPWGHGADGKPVDPRTAGAENPSVYAPCGTVRVSGADYARYAQWHLSGKPAPVLSDEKSLEHLHTGRADSPATGGKYGCGWIVLASGLGRVWTHAGSNTNSHALIWILPDRDIAAIVLTNTGERSGLVACDAAIQHLMKRYAVPVAKN
jgi:CubicO group peptidase (beta-lactamase class C family)